MEILLQVYGLTSGRAAALVPVVLGLISVIIAWWALRRSAGSVSSLRVKVIIGLALGVAAIIISSLHLARTNASIGSGSGKLGAIVALVLGMTGTTLNAIRRFRK